MMSRKALGPARFHLGSVGVRREPRLKSLTSGSQGVVPIQILHFAVAWEVLETQNNPAPHRTSALTD